MLKEIAFIYIVIGIFVSSHIPGEDYTLVWFWLPVTIREIIRYRREKHADITDLCSDRADRGDGNGK